MGALERDLKSPFVEKETPCPVCGIKYPQTFFRQHLFAPLKMDTDKHVTEYQWLSDDVLRVHPPYYFLYSCPHCSFTDLTNDYLHPDDNMFNHDIISAYRNLKPKQHDIVDFLGSHLWYDNIDHPSALNLHFLALFIQLQTKRELQDTHKIGRILLRIAWLYRELDGEEDKALDNGPFFSYDSYSLFFDALKEMWPSVPGNESVALSSVILHFQLALEADPRFDDDESYVTLAELIMDLMIRSENLDAAFNMVRSISIVGSDARVRIRRRLREHRMDDETYRRTEKSMNRVNDVLERVGETHHALINRVIEREMPRIQSIVKKLADKPWDRIEAELLQNDFTPAIIANLKGEGGALEHLANKKKFWLF